MSWRQGQAYGQDLRDRVLAAEGSLSAVARRFGVSTTYVARARARQKRLGESTPGPQCNHVPPKLAGLEQVLVAHVESQPDQTLAQLCQWMQAEHGVQVSVTTMWTTLDRLGLSYKKTLHAAEQTRADIAQARQDWAANQPQLDVQRLVFLDETWVSTNMTPIRGRAPTGQRCIGHAPDGHWKTTTFVCALRSCGLVAPLVLDGPINGVIFRAWVEQFLVPELHPGDMVVMNNLGSHKVAGIAEAIEAAGAQLCYLPPYSPDFNPIEQVFSKFKSLLRKISARTVDALWSACGTLLQQFSADEFLRYIHHAGYGQSG